MKRPSALLYILTLATLLSVGVLVYGQPVTITVYHNPSHGYDRWVQAALDRFNEANPDIHATLVTGNIDRLLTMIAGGTPPDLMQGTGDRYVSQWAYQGILQPLDPFIAKDQEYDESGFVPSLLPILSWNEQLYGLPRNWSAGAIISDVYLFEQYGVALPSDDWTWDEFLETAKKLTLDRSGSGVPDVYGFTGLYGNVHRWPAWIWNSGGDVWNADMTKSTLDSPQALEGLRFYEKIWMTERVSNIAHGNSTHRSELMVNHNVAMMHDLRQSIGLVLDVNPNFEVHVSPLPVGPVGPENRTHIAIIDFLGMYANTPHPEEAWRVLSYLVSDEGLLAGMELQPVMGYHTALVSRLEPLRQRLIEAPVESNPEGWISITQNMRGTSANHPVLGSDHVGRVLSQEVFNPMRAGTRSIEQGAREAALQLNALVQQALEDGHSW